jgi:hypothetical protein
VCAAAAAGSNSKRGQDRRRTEILLLNTHASSTDRQTHARLWEGLACGRYRCEGWESGAGGMREVHTSACAIERIQQMAHLTHHLSARHRPASTAWNRDVAAHRFIASISPRSLASERCVCACLACLRDKGGAGLYRDRGHQRRSCARVDELSHGRLMACLLKLSCF